MRDAARIALTALAAFAASGGAGDTGDTGGAGDAGESLAGGVEEARLVLFDKAALDVFASVRRELGHGSMVD
jgi:hypothetical protein